MFRIVTITALTLFCCTIRASEDLAKSNLMIKNLIKQYAPEYKYLPLSYNECPQEIVKFIGNGEQIIALATPILPTLLSAQFKHVTVVHTSASQLRFTTRLHKAFLAETMGSLVQGIEQNFIDLNQGNLVHPTSIHYYLQNIFAPVMHKKSQIYGDMKIELAQILRIMPPQKSTLFISTYLEQETNTAVIWEVITQWLNLGHEVVFTLTSDSPILSLNNNTWKLYNKASSLFPGTIYYRIVRRH